MSAPEVAGKVASGSKVSRETKDGIGAYLALILKWTDKINLISRKEANEEAIRQRHIEDSLQILPLIPPTVTRAIDLGSGAGLPGIVIAIARPDIHVTLIEADRRKAAFLQTVVAELRLAATVLPIRIEDAALPRTQLVMARALAPLPTLLNYAAPLIAPDGVCIFPKGRGVEAELAATAPDWTMTVERFPSTTDAQASILRIRDLRRAGAPP